MNRIRGIRTFQQFSLAALVTLAVAPFVASACSKDKPAANPQGGTGGMNPSGLPNCADLPPGYVGQPGACVSATATPAINPAGSTSAMPPTSASAAASANAPDLGTWLAGVFTTLGQNPDAAEAGLKALATRVAPGMQPEGQLLKQTFAENARVGMMVQMQAGKCYTIVGYSPPGGVKDLDLNVMGPPLYTQPIMSDKSTNNTPVIGTGAGATCPILPIPIQYKLETVAKSGSGLVLVQVYSKTK